MPHELSSSGLFPIIKCVKTTLSVQVDAGGCSPRSPAWCRLLKGRDACAGIATSRPRPGLLTVALFITL